MFCSFSHGLFPTALYLATGLTELSMNNLRLSGAFPHDLGAHLTALSNLYMHSHRYSTNLSINGKIRINTCILRYQFIVILNLFCRKHYSFKCYQFAILRFGFARWNSTENAHFIEINIVINKRKQKIIW